MGPRGEGKTALHVAAEHGHASNLAILVEAGASLLIRDNLGELNIYFNRICIFVYFDIQIYKFNKKKLIILIMAKIMPILKIEIRGQKAIYILLVKIFAWYVFSVVDCCSCFI